MRVRRAPRRGAGGTARAISRAREWRAPPRTTSAIAPAKGGRPTRKRETPEPGQDPRRAYAAADVLERSGVRLVADQQSEENDGEESRQGGQRRDAQRLA